MLQYGGYDAVVFALAVPLMVVAIGLASWLSSPGVSGLRAMWTYREDWWLDCHREDEDRVLDVKNGKNAQNDVKKLGERVRNEGTLEKRAGDHLAVDVPDDRGYAYRACVCGDDIQLMA